jgi:hypothetical protein
MATPLYNNNTDPIIIPDNLLFYHIPRSDMDMSFLIRRLARGIMRRATLSAKKFVEGQVLSSSSSLPQQTQSSRHQLPTFLASNRKVF